MTKRIKPKLSVPVGPIDPASLPGDPCSAKLIREAAALAGCNEAEQEAAVAALEAEEHAEAEQMIATLLDHAGEKGWTHVLHAIPAALLEVINTAEQGNSEQARYLQQLHPSTKLERNNLDLRVDADTQIREYVRWCKQQGKSPDDRAINYLRRNPKPPMRPRGKRPSYSTSQRMLEIAARIHQQLKKNSHLTLSAAAEDVLKNMQSYDRTLDLKTALNAAKLFGVKRSTVGAPSEEIERELHRIESGGKF
jgi:hypothetical protein